MPLRVATRAVGFYPTVSPLPSVTLGRSVFCWTSETSLPPRRYLEPCSVEPRLSSGPRAPSDHHIHFVVEGGDKNCRDYLGTIALPTELHPDLSVKMMGFEPTTHGLIVIPTAFTTLGPPGRNRTSTSRLSGGRSEPLDHWRVASPRGIEPRLTG